MRLTAANKFFYRICSNRIVTGWRIDSSLNGYNSRKSLQTRNGDIDCTFIQNGHVIIGKELEKLADIKLIDHASFRPI